MAFLDELADGFWCGGYPRFAGPDFGWYADAHMDEGQVQAR